MLIRHRAQTWAADRFRWVQYPRITAAQGFASAAQMLAREPVSHLIRACLSLLALFWLIVVWGIIAGMALVAWAFIRAVIGAA